MAIIELARNFWPQKLKALQFSEDICVERRKLYDVTEQDKKF